MTSFMFSNSGSYELQSWDFNTGWFMHGIYNLIYDGTVFYSRIYSRIPDANTSGINIVTFSFGFLSLSILLKKFKGIIR